MVDEREKEKGYNHRKKCSNIIKLFKKYFYTTDKGFINWKK